MEGLQILGKDEVVELLHNHHNDQLITLKLTKTALLHSGVTLCNIIDYYDQPDNWLKWISKFPC